MDNDWRVPLGTQFGKFADVEQRSNKINRGGNSKWALQMRPGDDVRPGSNKANGLRACGQFISD
jgi:hypothetical protein